MNQHKQPSKHHDSKRVATSPLGEIDVLSWKFRIRGKNLNKDWIKHLVKD